MGWLLGAQVQIRLHRVCAVGLRSGRLIGFARERMSKTFVWTSSGDLQSKKTGRWLPQSKRLLALFGALGILRLGRRVPTQSLLLRGESWVVHLLRRKRRHNIQDCVFAWRAGGKRPLRMAAKIPHLYRLCQLRRRCLVAGHRMQSQRGDPQHTLNALAKSLFEGCCLEGHKSVRRRRLAGPTLWIGLR